MEAVDAASAALDALIDGWSAEDRAMDAWRESALRHKAKKREANRSAWIDFYLRMAGSLRASADEYDRKAAALKKQIEQIGAR